METTPDISQIQLVTSDMKKRSSHEHTPRSERKSPKNQQNDSPILEGSFLGQTWQKSANITEDDIKSRGMPSSISMVKDKSDVSLKLDLSEFRLPLSTLAMQHENESPKETKERSSHPRSSPTRSSGYRSPTKHQIPYGRARKDIAFDSSRADYKAREEDYAYEEDDEKPIVFVKSTQIETKILENEGDLPENMEERRILEKRVTKEKPMDFDKLEIQRKISNVVAKISSLENVGESSPSREVVRANKPDFPLQRGKSYVEEKTVKRVITEILPGKKLRLTPMHKRENVYLPTETDKEIFREDQRRIVSHRRVQYANRPKGVIREVEVTELVRTTLEAALIIQRWFRQHRGSVRRSIFLEKPEEQKPKEEKRSSIIVSAKPSDTKDAGSLHNTATFATPVSMSKVASPRSLEIPESDEMPRRRAPEKIKASGASPDKTDSEKERLESAKKKLRLLREAEIRAAIKIQRKYRQWRRKHPGRFINTAVQVDPASMAFDLSILFSDEFNLFCKALSENPLFNSALSYQWLILYFQKRLAQGIQEAGPNSDIREIMRKILSGIPVTKEQAERATGSQNQAFSYQSK